MQNMKYTTAYTRHKFTLYCTATTATFQNYSSGQF